MSNDSMISVLAISGSLREQSYSTAVIRALAAAVPARVRVDQAEIGMLPFYNQDVDTDEKRPVLVRSFKERVAKCDGLLVVTPEYNYGLPAVLKNAIDWASRPSYASVLKGKPVVCMTASPGPYGGVRAHAHLQQLFSATLSQQIVVPQVAIGSVAGKVTDGLLSDAQSLVIAITALEKLIESIDLLRAGRDDTGLLDGSRLRTG
jgi:chromate reductase